MPVDFRACLAVFGGVVDVDCVHQARVDGYLNCCLNLTRLVPGDHDWNLGMTRVSNHLIPRDWTCFHLMDDFAESRLHQNMLHES